MSEEQKTLSDKEAEQELADAAEAFSEDTGNPEEAAADMQADMARTEKEETALGSSDPRAEEAAKEFIKQLENVGTAQVEPQDETSSPKKEETAKENQRILAALGFKSYEDGGVIKYNIRVMGIKIGVTFNETNPLGKLWAYKIPEGNEEKEFLKNGDLKEHPLILKYRAIQEGKEPLPEISITGKILEKRGKAIVVEIEENGEKKEIFYGQTTPKKDSDGYFIPAGFSKATKDHEAKMSLPRDIRLPDYLTQLEQAPAADTTKEKDASTEKGEAQPTDKSTLADAMVPKKLATHVEGEKPTVDYYVNLIGEITEKVGAEERIETRERGYAINMIFNAITRDTRTALIAELKNGGDQEEQA